MQPSAKAILETRKELKEENSHDNQAESGASAEFLGRCKKEGR